MRLAALAWAAALALTAGRPASLQPPRVAREQMRAALTPTDPWWVVYGTADPHMAPLLEQRGMAIARRLLGTETRVRADVAIGARAIAQGHVMLIGGPRENAWTRRLAPSLPVRFTANGFQWFGHDYADPADVIQLMYPNPLAAGRLLVLVAANGPLGWSHRTRGMTLGADDWRIFRGGELARHGAFTDGSARPWAYDPALDRDREAERRRFFASLVSETRGSLVVRAPPGLAIAAAARDAGRALLARCDRLGFPAGADRVHLTLYPSLEQKGVLVRSTRPEHVDDHGDAHAALPPGRSELDLWSVAAARLVGSGASPESRFLEPAAVWLAGRFEGEPLELSIRRLYRGGLLPNPRLAATTGPEWRSPLVWTPARALLVGSLLDCARPGRRAVGPRARALFVRSAPGALDSLCRIVSVDPARVTRRYAELADSLTRVAARAPETRRPHRWRIDDGFQRGVCLAHTTTLEGGYLSEQSARELEALAGLGVNWVSLTPFGFMPSPTVPVITPSAEGGPDAESDEAVCAAAARAQALGLRVWLKPHLWTRGWVGELAFSPAQWTSFFDAYRSFLLHYALLAQREGIDGLVVGHELPTATLDHPDRWRRLIADVRRVYQGTLTYGAHWRREVEELSFWEALDLVGVSFYAPIANRPGRSPAQLRVGAERALDRIRAVTVKARRPAVLLEVGYAAHRDASARPWEDESGTPDLETQRRCYQALADAARSEEWLAGLFWWKRFSSPSDAGVFDGSFSPRGKPAESVLRRAFQEWRFRRVRLSRR